MGAAFTALVQSSSATTGIVIMLASQGFLSLEAGIALAIGANIGTCITAVLAAIGKPVDAVRAAVVHVLFNVIGAAIWFLFIPDLAELSRSISPAAPDLEGIARLAAETPREIANANTIFNVANTILLLGFTGPIAKLAVKLVPDRLSGIPETIQPKYLDKIYLQTPSMALDRVRLELGQMGEEVLRMLDAARDSFQNRSRDGLRQAASMDKDVDELHRAVLRYIRDLSRAELTWAQTQRSGELVAIANYLESMGDLVAKNMVAQALHLVDLNEVDRAKLAGTTLEAVQVSLKDAVQALSDEDKELASRVAARKPEVKAMAAAELSRLGEMLRSGEIELDVFRVAADVTGQADRLFHDIRKMSEILANGESAR